MIERDLSERKRTMEHTETKRKNPALLLLPAVLALAWPTMLEELMQTWMAKMEDNCLFISAREKTGIEQFRNTLYDRVKELHVQKYPYNDFLFQKYEEEI